jgi:hypothetical protein
MPDTDPRASLEFVLGQMDMKLTNICREVGEIKAAMECKSADCEECKAEIDSDFNTVHDRINSLKKTHTGEEAVKSWKDKTLGETATMIGAGAGIVALVAYVIHGITTGDWS